jgi:hypothetical protein
MGGINSGKRAATPDTDDCLRLSLTELRRGGAVKRYQMSRRTFKWSRGDLTSGEVTVVVDIDCFEPTPCLRITGWAFGHGIDQWLEIVAQPQPYGGERFFILCPITGTRCTTLVLPPEQSSFASVRGWGVPYTSQRERVVERANRSIRKLEGRLRGLSKYARRPTRRRLGQRYEDASDIVAAYEEYLLARL